MRVAALWQSHSFTAPPSAAAIGTKKYVYPRPRNRRQTVLKSEFPRTIWSHFRNRQTLRLTDIAVCFSIYKHEPRLDTSVHEPQLERCIATMAPVKDGADQLDFISVAAKQSGNRNIGTAMGDSFAEPQQQHSACASDDGLFDNRPRNARISLCPRASNSWSWELQNRRFARRNSSWLGGARRWFLPWGAWRSGQFPRCGVTTLLLTGVIYGIVAV